MIQSVSIRNFAIIEQLDLQLQNGFMVITGETGAGKSIIFDAISLAIGGRASTEMIRHGQKSAQVEVVFALDKKQRTRIFPLLEEYGCPEDDLLYVKRILTSNGRNRVFINGSLSSLRAVQEITTGMVDIIGQHANYELLNAQKHVEMLDIFADQTSFANQVRFQVGELRSLYREVEDLRAKETTRAARLTALQAQLEEIQLADIKPQEDVSLNQILEKMLNAENLRERTTTAVYMLRDAESSVIGQVSTIKDQLRSVAYLDETLEKSLAVLENIDIELTEMARDMRMLAEQLDISEEEIEQLQERIILIERLKETHGGSIEGVLLAVKEIHQEMDSLAAADMRIVQAEKEASILLSQIMKNATLLSRKRQKHAKIMESLVEQDLMQLGMPRCRFQVRFQFYDASGQEVSSVTQAASASLTSNGLDNIAFYIAPNPGEGFSPLEKTASGGELSRILLAIKGALIMTDPVASYIFDEVDSGIGGGIAEVVGQKLQNVGSARQALCITHLPQVACCAHHHLKVAKQVKKDRTTSIIRYLNDNERVNEVSRMLGGIELTSRTKEHAFEMLKRNRPGV